MNREFFNFHAEARGESALPRKRGSATAVQHVAMGHVRSFAADLLSDLPDIEASNFAISQVEDVPDRFVPEPVRLILQRPALQIPHRLADSTTIDPSGPLPKLKGSTCGLTMAH